MSKPYCGNTTFAIPGQKGFFNYQRERLCVKPPPGLPDQFYKFWAEEVAPVLYHQLLEGRCQQLHCDITATELANESIDFTY